MRVFFTNLGCKLNQAELERLEREFVAAGHRVAPALEDADLHVVNSCTVTHAAARDSRRTARRARRIGRGTLTVLTGCYVESDPEEAAALAGVDMVVPNADKELLLERIHDRFPRLAVAGVEGPTPVPYVPLDFGNSRALVKIEDGCDMRCAFCIIPSTRGAQRSRPADEIVAEVRALAEGGFSEVVMTGVQISSYRSGSLRLGALVRRLLAETPVGRLRLTSIAPWQLDDDLVELFAHPRVCRHVHMSLQSGCDATLRRMRRPYSTAAFADRAERLRSVVGGLALTTDVIVGFPGEDEGEHADSLRFVEELGFARIHAFPYSRRPGTEAAEMPGLPPPPTVKRRMRAMLDVARRSARRFARSHVGARAEVLWEHRSGRHWIGTSDNYLKVSMDAPHDLALRVTPVRLDGIEGDTLRATPLDRSRERFPRAVARAASAR